MMSILKSAALTMAALCLQPVFAQTSGAERIVQLEEVNNLDKAGARPFHLKMDFQLFDLIGKPSDAGTIEVWWTSTSQRRVVIDSQLLHHLEKNTATIPATREEYLVNHLIDDTIHPIARHALRPGEKVEPQPGYFGKVTLDCITLKRSTSAFHSQPDFPTFCAEPKTDTVRYVSVPSGSEVLMRNMIGTFRETKTATSLRVQFAGTVAITGNVTTLQGFEADPEASSGTDPKATWHTEGKFAGGENIKKVEPMYPPAAKILHTDGNVLLGARVTKDGSVKDVFPIACTNPIFTVAATDVLSQWKYAPLTINGEPQEHLLTLTINFTEH